MAEEMETRPWQHIEEILEQGDAEALTHYIDELPADEIARSFARLSVEDQEDIVRKLEWPDAAELMEQVPDALAVDLLRQISPPEAAHILDHMPSNERADLLVQIDAEEAEAILDNMAPDAAVDARLLASYPPGVAGGLMITEYLWHYETALVEDVIGDFREHAEIYSDYDVQYTYVVTEQMVLIGVIRLRDLVLAPSRRKISEIMIGDPLCVTDDTPLAELGRFFDEHAFIGVPVVDADHRLIGIVRNEDVDEALIDRSESDYLKSQGIVGGEELRSMTIWRRSSRRLSWLSINIVLNIIAASVIAIYQDTLSAVIALAVFLPIISDMSGCSGNQAVAVSIRELSLGLIKPFEIFRVWTKEVTVGLINGLVLGVLLGAAAYLWKGNLYLGGVVAAAMAINTVVAVSIGGCVPLLLKWLKSDPALASGPILTTITDMCGFLLVLSFATMMLAKLQ
ncbi:MAG: magnesium transporter [Thermodesulfobacteriota bacterium]